MSQYREEIQGLKGNLADQQGELEERQSALHSAKRQCQELREQLIEAGADKERSLAQRELEGRSASEQVEDLKLRAERELAAAR